MGKKQRIHSRQERLKKQAGKRSVEVAQANARDAELRRWGTLSGARLYRELIEDTLLNLSRIK